MSVSAIFSADNGTLNVFGDNLDNTISISRNAAGSLLVNGGAISILGGAATVSNTSQIQLFGLGGNDTLEFIESNGALPRASIFGGLGNDVLIGGSGNDSLFGQGGNDTLTGRGGIDFLVGGADNDVLTGGDGDDQVFGESGNDRLVWNPGDDTDLNEGGTGIDTIEVNGGNGAESFTVTANGTRVRFDRVNPAPFSLDIGTSENLVINMNGGDDNFSATGNLAALIQITVDGGVGNDTLFGSNGADLLLGGDGNDIVDGQQGNDVAFLGVGNDTFIWDPGDGSDIVEGQAGFDTMQFNGSGVNESFDLSGNGNRLRFFRDVGNIVMDTNDVEQVNLEALGGADTITLNDLSGTDATDVQIKLGSVLGGTAGDAQVDQVVVNGTNGSDGIFVFDTGLLTQVVGLAATVTITGTEPNSDQLRVNALAGDDVIEASDLTSNSIRLSVDAGDGDDIAIGGAGNDVLAGGDGDDVLLGGPGVDLLEGGAGNNIVIH